MMGWQYWQCAYCGQYNPEQKFCCSGCGASWVTRYVEEANYKIDYGDSDYLYKGDSDYFYKGGVDVEARPCQYGAVWVNDYYGMVIRR